jgi:hypothetical protein
MRGGFLYQLKEVLWGESLQQLPTLKCISSNFFRELNLKATYKIDTAFALSKLPSIHEAVFDSLADQSEPMCHPETRIDLLCEINDWALNTQSKCIF